jgi:O-antigen/teichoic acid export membrane protein
MIQAPGIRRIATGPFVAGVLDQVLSSATNLAVSILAARRLGPAGLGTVFAGFAAYLLALGLLRALVAEPLVSLSAGADGDHVRSLTGHGVRRALAIGAISSAAFVATGAVLGGAVGRGLLLFAPWIVPALLQDYWRAMLFRNRTAWRAVANDGVWAVGMLVAALAFAGVHGDWIVVATWGIGATAGALLGFAQVGFDFDRSAKEAWRSGASELGWWLGATSIVFNAGTYGVTVIVAIIASSSSLGGLRSVQTVFAPLTLLAPALALPGLPLIVRAESGSKALADRYAFFISLACAVMTAGYLVVVWSTRGSLLRLVFGSSFGRFGFLIVPVGLAELATSVSLGSVLLLKARRSGREFFLARTIGSVVAVVATLLLTRASGVRGAAWGLLIGAGASSAAILGFSRRRRNPMVIS